MVTSCAATDEILVLSSWVPVPGLGVIPANAFLVRGAEPMVVDAGVAAGREDFLATLSTHIDPADLRWLWLTHTDPDHIGGVWRLLDAPWLHRVDRAAFADALDEVRRLSPPIVLSSHLPMAPGMLERFLTTLAQVPDRTPFLAPDQAALQAMLVQAGQG